MADRKISDLTALTTPASGDYLPIVDISESAAASKNKRITIQSLFQGIPVNVGIGTSSPSFTAHVSGTKNTTQLFVAAPTISAVDDFTQIGFGLSTTAFGVIRLGFDNPSAITNSYFSFFNDNGSGLQERLRIDSSGRLGLGTSSPQALLHLNGAFGTSTTANALTIRNSSPSSASNIAQADFWCANTFGGNEAVAAIQGLNPNASANNGGAIAFAVSSNGTATTPTERMRLTPTGLGIGTASPGSLLHLADAGNITVGTTTGTKIGTATTQKIGFYNATPVVQPTAVADATDAATVITQLNALLAKLRTLGIIAT
jgi:hypothetical protein